MVEDQILSNLKPGRFIESACIHRRLILQLIRREIEARYRGTFLGLVWAVLVPLLMLAVYTFVFSVVFSARWGEAVSSRPQFSLLLFSGIILFGLFSECINRAPSLMLENVAYIKRVVFPLEALIWIQLGVALFNTGVSFIVLALLYPWVFGLPPLTIFLLPILLVPFCLMLLGLMWFLSALGVYLRDVRQFIVVLTTLLMFLSPIFYPLSAIPEALRSYIYLNPLAIFLEQSKDLIFWGSVPAWTSFVGLLLGSWALAVLGYAWFMKTKKGFADVI